MFREEVLALEQLTIHEELLSGNVRDIVFELLD